MLKLAKYLHTQFWLFIAWLIISTAIVLSLLRFYLPSLDLSPFTQEIERVVEQSVRMPLHIGRMNARISGVHLGLQFKAISLLEPNTGAVLLNFREARVDIHLLRSLWEGRLVLGQGMLVGGRLDLLQRRDGVIVVNGFPLGASQATGNPLSEAFLRHSQLRVRDSEILWREEGSGRRPLHLKQVNANLLNEAGRHRLTALAGLRGKDRQQMVRVIADLHEDHENPVRLSGTVYVKGRELGMTGRLGGVLPPQSQLKRGILDLELWAEIKQGLPVRIDGSLGLRGLVLAGAQDQSLKLRQVSGNLAWQRQENGWLAALDRLVLMDENRLWPPGRLVVLKRTLESGEEELLAGADYLGIRQASRLAFLLMPGDGQLKQALAGLGPSGHLSRLRLSGRQAVGKSPRWQVSGSITQFSNLPWKGVPGLSGLDMNFAGNQDGGSVRLESHRFGTEMPGLFRERLDASKLDGRFNWRYSQQQGIRLETSDLLVSTGHLKTRSRLRLELPLQDDKRSFIDMQTDFWDGDGAQKSRYLPVGIMPKPLVNWLDHSLVSGRIKSGSMLLYGPLKSFPYNDLEGRFEVLFGIEEMVLDYHQGWPRLEEGVAEAHFLNNSLSIELLEAKMLGAELNSGKAIIRQLKGASPVEIVGDFSGDLSQMLRFLDETPLQSRFGRFTRMAKGAGRSRAWIDLRVPLKSADRFAINGRIDLRNASLSLDELDLHFGRLQGSLDFDTQAVKTKGLKGRLFDQSLRFDIDIAEMDGAPATRISTSLQVDRPLLERYMPLLLVHPFLGETQAQVRVEISHQTAEVPVRLHAVSDLAGMALDLPKPFGKTAAEARRTTLSMAFRGDGHSDLEINYADQVRALLRNAGKGFNRGDVLIGQGEPVLPGDSRLQVRGDLSRLDLDSWVVWLMRQPSPEGKDETPLRFELLAKQFMLAGVECADTRFDLGRTAEGWRLQIGSPQMAGTLLVPNNLDKLPIDARFTTLKLQSKAWFGKDEAGQGESSDEALNPRRVPALKLQVEQLYIDENLFGAAQVQWRKGPAGIDLQRFSLVGEGLALSGTGSWHQSEGVDTTALYLEGKVDSLGELQEKLQLQLGVSEAPMEFKADLQWQESPLELDLSRMNGSLALKVGAGEVTEVDPGVGRLVGLLSLHALGKRLLLDFSDLFAKGLEFDSIEGNFDLKGGSAFTQDLLMEGPSVKVHMKGRIGLKAKDYDQTVSVIPRLSSTLPVVGALAVNPAVGVALAVVQQVIGKKVDSFTQTRYALSGSWESPVIEKLERKPKDGGTEMMPDLP